MELVTSSQQQRYWAMPFVLHSDQEEPVVNYVGSLVRVFTFTSRRNVFDFGSGDGSV